MFSLLQREHTTGRIHGFISGVSGYGQAGVSERAHVHRRRPNPKCIVGETGVPCDKEVLGLHNKIELR